MHLAARSTTCSLMGKRSSADPNAGELRQEPKTKLDMPGRLIYQDEGTLCRALAAVRTRKIATRLGQ